MLDVGSERPFELEVGQPTKHPLVLSSAVHPACERNLLSITEEASLGRSDVPE